MSITLLDAIPHSTLQEDEYRNYRILKGAGIVNNVYTIHNDPERYSESRRFKLDRFAHDKQSAFDAAINPDVSQRDHFTFGAGRRICAGMHIAERSLFLAIAKILWAFDIKPATDQEGNPLLPDPNRLTQGFACEPLEFEADIRLRSEEKARILLKQWRTAQATHLDPETQQWVKVPPQMAVSDIKDS